jgi:hypothetical protein
MSAEYDDIVDDDDRSSVGSNTNPVITNDTTVNANALQNEFLPYTRNNNGYYHNGHNSKTLISMIERAYSNSLTEQSPRAETPPEIKVSLKSHQAALLDEMESRERSLRNGRRCIDNSVLYSRYAILGDAVGAGKSLAVLAHIARMKRAQNPPPNPAYYHKLSTPNLYSIWEPNVKHNRSATLILVPHSLYRQWSNYIKTQTTLKVAECKTKKFFANTAAARDEIIAADAVLVPSTLYAEIQALASTENIYWVRAFVDEVDSIHIPARREPITADFTWLISATWSSCITPKYSYITANTLEYLISCGQVNLDTAHDDFKTNFLATGLQTAQTRNHIVIDCNWTSVNFFAAFVSQHPHQDQLIVRTSDAFRKMSLALPAIEHEIIRCKTTLHQRLVNGLLTTDVRQMLHAGDISGALAELGVREETPMTLVDAVMMNQKKELARLKQTLEFKQGLEYSTPALKVAALENLQQKIISLETQIASFEERIKELDTSTTCGICLDTPQNPTCVPCCKQIMCGACVLTHLTYKSSCPMCRGPLTVRDLHRITASKKSNKKAESADPELLKKSDALLKYITENPNGKFIVFSRYDNPFAGLIAELEARNISVQEAKGNKDAIYNLIKRFRSGEVRVLFLNSQYFASGMNLESATHVIMYHGGIPPSEKEQIIGRAQRLGRTGSLKVIQLLHEDE